VDNRPYRNKLDLLSRMVIPQQAYSAIKHQVAVGEGLPNPSKSQVNETLASRSSGGLLESHSEKWHQTHQPPPDHGAG
jgi:hypothetical protein